MAIRLNANIVALRTQAALVRSDRLLGTSIERLSTGLRIQTSADDPAGLTIANTMRHQLHGLERATRNVEDGVSMVQTAEGGMDQISAVLLKARQLAIQAANTGPSDTAQFTALQAELDNIIDSVNRIAGNTLFAGKHILTGDLSTNTLSDGRIDPADNAKALYTDLRHDLRYLPGGILEGSEIRIDPPTSALFADRIAVRFAGAPSGDTPIDGLDQISKTGSAQQTDTLTVNGGEEVVVTGPLGSQTLTLQASTTIDDMVQMVNAFSDRIGARASYDATTGQLTLSSTGYGSGMLSVHSQDLSGGGNVGLLDVDTADPVAKRLATEPALIGMDLIDGRSGFAADTTTPIADLVGNNTNPPFTAAFNDIADKHLTIFGPTGHGTFTMNATSLDEVLEIINDNTLLAQGTVSYDSNTNTLSVTDTGVPTTVNTVLTPQDSLRDIVALIDATLTSSPDLAIDPVAGTIAITDAGVPVASLDLESPTLGDLVDYINTHEDDFGAEARIIAGRLEVRGSRGPVMVASDDLTRDGLGFGLLDLATADVDDNGGLSASQPVYAVSLSDDDRLPVGSEPLAGLAANGVRLDNAVGQTVTIDDGVNPATVLTITASTTIDDIVDQVNAATLAARADYHDGVLRITGTGSNLTITSQDMTANVNTDVGLFDGDTTSAGNGDAAIQTRPTTTVHYTDADGVERSALLHQVTGSNGGRDYVNLTGSPAVVYEDMGGHDQARFDAFEPGAFRLTLRDARPGTDSAYLTAATTSMTATRLSRTRIQTGAKTGQQVTVDIRDMRAAALGHRDELVADGFRSLQDLKDRRVFLDGFYDEAIKVIDAAIDDVSSQRGDAGSIQAATLEPTLSYLRVSIENLTESESRIRDTDFAKESAEFAKQNIKVQAATAMLAQANQVPQSVLQLLQ